MAKPETLFRTRLRKRLEEIPNSWWESIQQRAILGTPDIIGVINGLFVGLELKATDKAPVSEMQIYKLKKIGIAGGLGFIVHPGNADETVELLRHLGEKNNDQSHAQPTKQQPCESGASVSDPNENRPDGSIPG